MVFRFAGAVVYFYQQGAAGESIPERRLKARTIETFVFSDAACMSSSFGSCESSNRIPLGTEICVRVG